MCYKLAFSSDALSRAQRSRRTKYYVFVVEFMNRRLDAALAKCLLLLRGSLLHVLELVEDPGRGCCTPPSRAPGANAPKMAMRAVEAGSLHRARSAASEPAPACPAGRQPRGPQAREQHPSSSRQPFACPRAGRRPGPRMLYATQPSTGTNAPKMMMRASRPAVCMSSVSGVSLLGHAQQSGSREARRPASNTLLLRGSLLHVLELVEDPGRGCCTPPSRARARTRRR